jgi:transposase
MITDDHWAVLGPMVDRAKRYTCGQPPKLPNRMFFEALLYGARTGIPWRDLPDVFGRWDAVYNRFRRWVRSGSLQALFESLTDHPLFGDIRRVFIDATIIRAHPHAAGARRKHRKIGPARSATAQGLGRSRGGFTTKVIVTAADENTALAVDVLPGQAGDAPALDRMVDRTVARVGVIDEVVGDKAFDSDDRRCRLIDRDIAPQIPNRKNRVNPWPCDPVAYRERNRVERLFGKLKQFRRVATRYEKLKRMFMAVVHLAIGFIRLKRLRPTSIVNRT